MYNLTDGYHQTVYLAGFQKGGFDNNYPEMFEVDPRCGRTTDDLKNALAEGRKYNANVAYTYFI